MRPPPDRSWVEFDEPFSDLFGWLVAIGLISVLIGTALLMIGLVC